MEIANLSAGTTSLTNKQLETSVQSLRFAFTGANADTSSRTAFENLVGSTVVNIQKQGGNSTTTLVQSLALRDLAEISCHNSGVVTITTNGANKTVEFSLELSLEARLDLDEKESLILSVESIPAGRTVTIDAVDHALSSPYYIKYENKFCNANTAKDFSIDRAYAIALPIDSLQAVELTHNNGRVVKLTARELKGILIDSQDPVYNHDGKVQFGFDKWAVVSVEDFTNARVTLTASTNWILLTQQAI